MTKARQLIEAETQAPLGFRATLPNGDEIEWRFDPAAKAYRFTKRWTDEWSGKRRELLNAALQHARDNAAFVTTEMKRWQDGGWTVTPLEA